MVMNLYRRIFVGYVVLMLILVFVLEQIFYSSGEAVAKDKAESALLEAMTEEFNAQYKALGLYESGFNIEPGKAFEYCEVNSSAGKKVKGIAMNENETVLGMNIEARIHHAILAKEGIDADACLKILCRDAAYLM